MFAATHADESVFVDIDVSHLTDRQLALMEIDALPTPPDLARLPGFAHHRRCAADPVKAHAMWNHAVSVFINERHARRCS